jgi:osmotically-inducible protein OsmY
MKRFLVCLMAVLLVSSSMALAADQEAMEKERAEHRQQVAKAIAGMGQMMTEFDYITFYLSGPVVVLEGFTTKPVVKQDAETAVRKVEWVNHVVNKIEELSIEPTVNEIRAEVLSMVKKATPQSFPQDRAYIRVKVDKDMNVTLVGWADPMDKKRLEAAVVGIQNLPLVKKVDNQIVVQKIGD